jgi:cob(I)alamin adenosyltransferase
MDKTGKVYVITGDGKGKTTCALGLAWHAVSRGTPVFIVQFLKPRESSGEHFAAAAFGRALRIMPAGRKGFISRSGPRPADVELAMRGLREARAAMESGDFDLVILDEINVAAHMGLVPPEEVRGFVDARPKGVTLVLTGRSANADIISRADEVYEMGKVRHHFDAGVNAMQGIEY